MDRKTCLQGDHLPFSNAPLDHPKEPFMLLVDGLENIRNRLPASCGCCICSTIIFVDEWLEETKHRILFYTW